MERKRKPGAGTKSKGPYQGNTAVLGVRVRPEIRAELDRLAKAKGKGWSLSQEAQRAFKSWIDHQRGPHGPALGMAISRLVEQVNTDTEKSLDDPFTAAAIRASIDDLLMHFWPPPIGDEALTVPTRVRDRVAAEVQKEKGKLPAEVQSFELSPPGVGRRAASLVIMRIENAASEDLPGGLHPSMLDPEGYWEIRQALGSGMRRFQQRLDEAKKRDEKKGRRT